MNETVIWKIKEIVQPILDNVYIYVLFSLLIYFLGGLDDTLIGLIGLNILDIAVCLLSKERPNERLFINKIKIYILIIVGVTIDKLTGLDSNSTMRIRTYIILGFSYNEGVNIINTLCLDESFYIPKGIKKYIDKLYKKEMGYYNEQNEFENKK